MNPPYNAKPIGIPEKYKKIGEKRRMAKKILQKAWFLFIFYRMLLKK